MIRYQKQLLKRYKKSEKGENELGWNFSSLEGDRGRSKDKCFIYTTGSIATTL